MACPAAVRALHAAGFEVAVLSSSGKGEALAQELGGVGTTAEVGEPIACLASDKSGYITGQNIRIDGGITRAV